MVPKRILSLDLLRRGRVNRGGTFAVGSYLTHQLDGSRMLRTWKEQLLLLRLTFSLDRLIEVKSGYLSLRLLVTRPYYSWNWIPEKASITCK